MNEYRITYKAGHARKMPEPRMLHATSLRDRKRARELAEKATTKGEPAKAYIIIENERNGWTRAEVSRLDEKGARGKRGKWQPWESLDIEARRNHRRWLKK